MIIIVFSGQTLNQLFCIVVAPEVFSCAMDECVGYSFPADWWSLGVTAYELYCRTRPYDIHSNSSISDIRALYSYPVRYPSSCSTGFVQLLKRVTIKYAYYKISKHIVLQKFKNVINKFYPKMDKKCKINNYNFIKQN